MRIVIELPFFVYDILAFIALSVFVGGLFGFVYERFWGRCRRRVIITILSVYIIGFPTALGLFLTIFTVPI